MLAKAPLKTSDDVWLSTLVSELSRLELAPVYIDLDTEAQSLLESRRSSAAALPDCGATRHLEAKGRVIERLSFLPEPLLFQLHSAMSDNAALPRGILVTIQDAIQDRGFSQHDAQEFVQFLQQNPSESRLELARQIADPRRPRKGYSKGKIIEHPSYLSELEHERLRIPTLKALLVSHRKHAPQSDRCSLFEIGARDGATAASLSPYFDAATLMEGDTLSFNQLAARERELSNREHANDTPLTVTLIRGTLLDYLESQNRSAYDTVVVTQGLHLLSPELTDVALRDLTQSLTQSGLIILPLTSSTSSAASSTHLLASTGAHQAASDPSNVVQFLRYLDLEVLTFQRELKFRAVSREGLSALADIITHIIPDVAQDDPGVVEHYIRNHCKSSQGSQGFEFSHYLNFIVAIQPKAPPSQPTSTDIDLPPSDVAPLSSLPVEPTDAWQNGSIDFQQLLRNLGSGTSSGSRTMVKSPDGSAVKAHQLYSLDSPFSLRTLSAKARERFAAELVQQYRADYISKNAHTLGPFAINNLRLACAVAVATVDFASEGFRKQTEEILHRSADWGIDGVLDHSWREISGKDLSPEEAEILLAELSKEDPTFLRDKPFEPDVTAFSRTALLRRDDLSNTQNWADNQRLFLEYWRIRDELFGRLLELWPVQQAILQAVYAEAKKDNPVLASLNGRSVQQRWFYETHASWRALLPDIKSLLRTTHYQIQKDCSLKQLEANANFLRKIDLPFDFLWSHYERASSLAGKVQHISFDALKPQAQRAFLGGFACKPDEMRKTLAQLQEIEKRLRQARAEILQNNMGLVHREIKRQLSSLSRNSREEFVLDGAEGLSRAIDLFQRSRGKQFPTYAMWWIRQCISRTRWADSAMRLPEHYRRYRSALNKLPGTLGRPPSYEERVQHLMQLFGFDEDRAEIVLRTLDTKFVSASSSPRPNGDITLASIAFVADPSERRRHQERISEIRHLLTPVLETLDDKERQIISLLFGLSASQEAESGQIRLVGDAQEPEGRTLETVAHMLGVTRERIRQIALQVIENVRKSNSPLVDRLRQYTEGRMDLVRSGNRGTGDSLSERPVAALGLGIRINRALEKSGIYTVGDLEQCTPARLQSVPNIAAKTIEVIRAALQRVGRDLQPDT
jgi:RNA polymerase sigma factor (sigma-70 family)